MEQVLEVYRRQYDEQYPVVCMDEQPKQLIGETRSPLPPQSRQPEKFDYVYTRHGMCVTWMFVEPLAGWRDVRVTERKTAVDWAQQVRTLVDHPRYAKAKRITLVCDQLNTHVLASLYAAFEPAQAARLVRKLELVHSPKHGSWLNMAEPELSVLTRQCLRRRIAKVSTITSETARWATDRNAKQIGVDWQFTTKDARIKLKYLYPKVKT
jgi:DDE superfamily endonuclease